MHSQEKWKRENIWKIFFHWTAYLVKVKDRDNPDLARGHMSFPHPL